MIKSNEIRIGNWVQSRIEVGQKWNVIVSENDLIGNYKLFEPIPLTEDILFKCRSFSINFISRYKSVITFSSAKDNVCTFKQDFKHINLYCDYRKNQYYIKIEGGKKCYFKYLHGFQNLFFALTGEELIVNL